jgi:two-component system, oxyanion-binding sensor
MIKVKAGFLPLVDVALLVVAKEQGFAEACDVDLILVKESSWANVRDRLSVGQFDCAHMLAPLPIAQNLGLTPLPEKMIVPFALGLGGNAITVSSPLYAAMVADNTSTLANPMEAGGALKSVLAQRQKQGLRRPVFAVVHSYSSHAYELRYWLAACGINPEADVEITIVPPGLMADALAAGAIDGFCVGEPWNSIAMERGAGTVIATKASIWQSSPEKVLALRESWAARNQESLHGLLVALQRSALWAADTKNRAELALLLSQPEYVGASASLIARSLEGQVHPQLIQADFLLFAERAANFPWQSHALWFYSQMVRCGQIGLTAENAQAARATYRPDIYRQALQAEGIAMPGASLKVEGDLSEPVYLPASGGQLRMGPDGFFDGVRFDPDDLVGYIARSPFAALHKK